MQIAYFPVPRNELARLRAVARLRERSESTRAFIDSVVTAAASLAGTPMSAVTVVAEEAVQIRANCGLSNDDAARGDSMCAYTILGSEPFVIEDTRRDARFWAMPFVVGPPYVRFYAGFPLRVEGQPIGALCVIDDRPRTLSGEQFSRLAVLAAGAAAWLALGSPPDAGECGTVAHVAQ